MAGGGHSAKAPLAVLGLLLAPVLFIFGILAIATLGMGYLLNGGSSSTSSSAATAASLGPPVSLAGLHPPRALVSLDLTVSRAPASEVPCHVSASLLLADQSQEDGSWNPSQPSQHGTGLGIGQFSFGTWVNYDHPIPPGGANPPTRTNLVDSVYATARYMCSLGMDTTPAFDAVVGYNCGHNPVLQPVPPCWPQSYAYAGRVMAIAQKIAGGIQTAGATPAASSPTSSTSKTASKPPGG